MVILRCAPPPSTVTVQQWIVADYAQLRLMRVSIRTVIDTQSLRPGEDLDDLAERMTLVATELATNALRHGQSPAIVQLGRSSSAFLLDVADNLPSVAPRIIEKEPLGGGGRGLRITQELARDSGWYVANDCKHVWARFEIPRRIRRFQAPRILVPNFTSFRRLVRRRIR